MEDDIHSSFAESFKNFPYGTAYRNFFFPMAFLACIFIVLVVFCCQAKFSLQRLGNKIALLQTSLLSFNEKRTENDYESTQQRESVEPVQQTQTADVGGEEHNGNQTLEEQNVYIPMTCSTVASLGSGPEPHSSLLRRQRIDVPTRNRNDIDKDREERMGHILLNIPEESKRESVHLTNWYTRVTRYTEILGPKPQNNELEESTKELEGKSESCMGLLEDQEQNDDAESEHDYATLDPEINESRDEPKKKEEPEGMALPAEDGSFSQEVPKEPSFSQEVPKEPATEEMPGQMQSCEKEADAIENGDKSHEPNLPEQTEKTERFHFISWVESSGLKESTRDFLLAHELTSYSALIAFAVFFDKEVIVLDVEGDQKDLLIKAVRKLAFQALNHAIE